MKKLAGSLIAMGLCTVAFAQQPAPVQQPSSKTIPFEMVDKNKDGQVNKEEASSVPGLDFASADANKNASLDRLEYTTAIVRVQPAPRG